MKLYSTMTRPTIGALLGLMVLAVPGAHHSTSAREPDDPLLPGFRQPPNTARPSTYWLMLNGYVNRRHVEPELRQLKDAGISDLCLFDMGARGVKEAMPPAGPAFMSRESVRDIAHILRVAKKLDMNVHLSVCSSWDMGGSWVEPRHGSMALYHSETTLEGPTAFDDVLPFPKTPEKAPKQADGKPAVATDVAVLGVPSGKRQAGHEFVFKLASGGPHTIDHVVLYNALSGEEKRYGLMHLFAKDFSVAVSTSPPEVWSFREVLKGSLKPNTKPQRFDFPPVEAGYVRLRILSGHNPDHDRVQLGEFEVYSQEGVNVVTAGNSHHARCETELLHYTSALGHAGRWTAGNIHDGAKSGPGGTWSSAGPPPLLIEDPEAIVDLTDRVDAKGRLEWNVPRGKWTIMRFVCANTGERLKVPSPNSNGLATDHLSREATETFLQYLIGQLRDEMGDLRNTALKQLYLASYEVRGRIWTPDFLDQFRRYRGYDMTRFLPVLNGSVVGGDQMTHRFRYDYRKTLGDLLVDAYYRTAMKTAHRAGLGIESEAGGPGPPVHQVPVDALEALGSIDTMRGEFWPRRPDANRLWVVKETACAAHIYGHRRVHMEAFTSFHHWQDGPIDLKPSADRAFCEGANHFVWHTAAHQPPEAGRPGWVYNAGTHLNPNLVWWPMAGAFLDYLGRCSYLLQQGLFVGDVCYYYGDQGYNFVPTKRVDPSLGYGYDYDVTCADVILNRMDVRDGRIVLPDGMSYELLVLPEREDIDLDVLRKLERLVAAGATVVGRKPTQSTGLTDARRRDRQVRQLADKLWGRGDGKAVRERGFGKGRIVSGRTLREVLQQRGVGPDFTFVARNGEADLDYLHRRTNEADIYFVSNKAATPATVDATFRVRGKAPELWFPETGDVRPQHVYRSKAEGTDVPLRFAPHGSVFVVFRRPIEDPHIVAARRDRSSGAAKDKPAAEALPDLEVVDLDGERARLLAFEGGTYAIETSDGRRVRVEADPLGGPRELTGPWQVRFPRGLGAPASITLPKLISWTEHPNDGVRHFSGIARYELDFEVAEEWLGPDRRVYLDLGRLWVVAKVTVNEQPIGVVWRPPYRVDVTGAARPGKNRLAVEVANTWSNRIVGDTRAAGGKRFTRTNMTRTGGKLWKDAPLLKSGLFGPVRLIPASATNVRFAEK